MKDPIPRRAGFLVAAALVAGGIVLITVMQGNGSPPPAGDETHTPEIGGDPGAAGVAPDAAGVEAKAAGNGTDVPLPSGPLTVRGGPRREGPAAVDTPSTMQPGSGGQQPIVPMSPGAGSGAPHMRRGADLAAEGTAGGKSLVEWQQLLANAEASTEERLQALSTMRVFGQKGWNEPTLNAAIDLGKTAKEPRVRASAWAVMLRAKKPALVAPLINAVQNDPDPGVRRAAAQTLMDYVERADVSDVLQRVRVNDADEAVSRQAARSLNMGRR